MMAYEDCFPKYECIVASVHIDIRAMRIGICPTTVIPGFKEIRVDGIRVGEWKTGDDLFKDGNQEILAAYYAVSLNEGEYYFINKEDCQRFRELPRQVKSTAEPELIVEFAILDRLERQGHVVARQVRVPLGIVDIVDYTAKTVIECKAFPSRSCVFQAVEQLHRYIPHFPGFSMAVGLPSRPDAPWINTALAAIQVEVVCPEGSRSADPGEAERFAEWLLARMDIHEVEHLLSVLPDVKIKDVSTAMKRKAA